ncbi:SH3, type 3 domain protein [Roseibacterium elongatum DSM 19469]|uniref:SH3, type 3 domain protein n=1 Tax=Roseicyclus elongatus DSM 19469 TaxID=1294273 RepID=W8RS47_9RHOB|nr:SH3 domain-containing protein [Roseibacterium elongatum]AHM03908.1 SH3, type 3 domain protein [Roseibacterium elongatum DSM 19469]
MLRLTLILFVVIWAVLIIFSDAPPEVMTRAPAPTEDVPGAPDAAPRDAALRETADGRLVLTTETGDELVIDLVVDPGQGALDRPARPLSPDAPVSAAPQEPSADPLPPATPARTEAAPRLRVTGDRVNFRAGPSTDDAILTALTQGEIVELIERAPDGWAHLRVVATGLTGYMSEDFLAPAN